MSNTVTGMNKFNGLLLMSIFISGCVLSAGSPHDNFKEHLYFAIGERIDKERPFRIPFNEDLVGTKMLPNGNIENKYKYRGTCRYYYEINPKSKLIVGARFEGNEADCVIVP